MRSILSIVVIVASLVGCGEAPHGGATTEKLRYVDASEQQQLKDALRNDGIPFEVHADNGREEIWYGSQYEARVTQIRDELFGVPPPMGRSISLGAERNAALVEELKRRNASFWRSKYREYEYIAWPPESDEAADTALQTLSVHPDGFIEMKKMREAADAERRNRTNRSSRSREERAPAER